MITQKQLFGCIFTPRHVGVIWNQKIRRHLFLKILGEYRHLVMMATMAPMAPMATMVIHRRSIDDQWWQWLLWRQCSCQWISISITNIDNGDLMVTLVPLAQIASLAIMVPMDRK